MLAAALTPPWPGAKAADDAKLVKAIKARESDWKQKSRLGGKKT